MSSNRSMPGVVLLTCYSIQPLRMFIPISSYAFKYSQATQHRRELQIELSEGTKVDYEAAIRTALRSNRAYQKDPRFAELWKSIQEGEARRSSSRAKSEGARSEVGDGDSDRHNRWAFYSSRIPTC